MGRNDSTRDGWARQYCSSSGYSPYCISCLDYKWLWIWLLCYFCTRQHLSTVVISGFDNVGNVPRQLISRNLRNVLKTWKFFWFDLKKILELVPGFYFPSLVPKSVHLTGHGLHPLGGLIKWTVCECLVCFISEIQLCPPRVRGPLSTGSIHLPRGH